MADVPIVGWDVAFTQDGIQVRITIECILYDYYSKKQ